MGIFAARAYPPTSPPASLQHESPPHQPKPTPQGTGLEAHKPGRAPAGGQLHSATLSRTRPRLSAKADLHSHIKLTHFGRLTLYSCCTKHAELGLSCASHRKGMFLEEETTRGLERGSLALAPSSPALNSQSTCAISK